MNASSTNHHQQIDEKARIFRDIAAGIAHELRTPLASISLCVDLLTSTFIKNTLQETGNGTLKLELTADEIRTLAIASDRVHKALQQANLFIDMMLLKVNPEKVKAHNAKAKVASIKQAVKEALAQYPLAEEDEKLIKIAIQEDFYAKLETMLFDHVIFNLLKNALYYIKNAEKGGTIEIWTKIGNEYNTLYFKDTGAGIAPELLPTIFNQFHTDTRHGAGIGLALCKAIMEEFGGRITCESKVGEFTEFALQFPHI